MTGKHVLLGHGSGGKLSHSLIQGLFMKAFDNEYLAQMNDQAIFDLPHSRLAFTTDSYVVNPIFFPGGDIGKLSVCGTINDLAMGGAVPHFLSASFIIEEGLSFDELERIVLSMSKTAAGAGVKIVTGDTKVVERGKGDRIFINTAGIGVVHDGIDLSPVNIRRGDIIISSGTVGDHGMAIMTHREGIRMDVPIESDCAPLHHLVRDILASSDGVRAMRDPTRGGVATTLNELAAQSNCGMVIRESDVPVRNEVKGACEILGFEPLYLANEGKLLVIVSSESADKVLDAMKGNPLGRDSAVIGHVTDEPKGKVLLETFIGNRRMMDMLSGEQLPRIC